MDGARRAIHSVANDDDEDATRNAPELINLDMSTTDETSTSRRRRSSSTSSSHDNESVPRPITSSNKRKKPDAHESDEEKEEASRTAIQNEAEVCPICLEEWTNSGQHRLVATDCGHLFGKMFVLIFPSLPSPHRSPL